MKASLCVSAAFFVCASAAPGRYHAPAPSAAAVVPTTRASPSHAETSYPYGLPSAVAIPTPPQSYDDQGSIVAVPMTPHYQASTETYAQGTFVAVPTGAYNQAPSVAVPTTAVYDGSFLTAVAVDGTPKTPSVDSHAFPTAAATTDYDDNGTIGSAPTRAYEQPLPTAAGNTNTKPRKGTHGYGTEQAGASLHQASSVSKVQVGTWLAVFVACGAGFLL